MVKVAGYLCLGCGLCTQSCSQEAIHIICGQARIVQNRCNSCGSCMEICPQGAIIEYSGISPQNLSVEIQDMKKQVEAMLARIEKIGSTSS